MRLIGAHVIGEQAIELIDIGLLSMQMNATSQAFIDACFNFPSLAELFKYATYDAMKRQQQGRVQGCIGELPAMRVVHGHGGNLWPDAAAAPSTAQGPDIAAWPARDLKQLTGVTQREGNQ